MSRKPFQFKQFSVADDRIAHKVGTDGVLLGAWVKLRGDERNILDVGTGCGLIALMIAQRTPDQTRIDAVEIEAHAAQQALENVMRSPWAGRINVHHAPVQEFDRGRCYDLLVANPPYFLRSLQPPDENRSRARHARDLTFEDLLKSATRLLTRSGRLAVILPYAEGLNFVALAQSYHLFTLRKTTFRARADKPGQRLLLEFGYEGDKEPETSIQLYDDGAEWSTEYRELTREFYVTEGIERKGKRCR